MNLQMEAEDLEDIRVIEDFLKNPDETFSMEIVESLADGENPLKAFRGYRNMTQSSLAKKVEISEQYISQLENGDIEGDIRLMKKIAKVLNISLDNLV